MLKTWAVSCASISFIFKPVLPDNLHKHIDLLNKYGSIGIGCTVNQYIKASAEINLSKTEIFFNLKRISLPTIITGLNFLTKTPLKISIESRLPLGCGFGISGAATLATLLAVNKLLKLKKTLRELSAIAHAAEILEKTGLGTVATQISGGFLIKKKAGIPPVFKRLNFAGKKIYATVIDSLTTPTILSDQNKLKKISREADKVFAEISKKKSLTLEDIINISYRYSLNSGLLTTGKMIKIIEQIRKSGGAATMAVIGQTIISNIKPWGVKYPIFELSIVEEKVKVL